MSDRTHYYLEISADSEDSVLRLAVEAFYRLDLAKYWDEAGVVQELVSPDTMHPSRTFELEDHVVGDGQDIALRIHSAMKDAGQLQAFSVTELPGLEDGQLIRFSPEHGLHWVACDYKGNATITAETYQRVRAENPDTENVIQELDNLFGTKWDALFTHVEGR